MNNKINISSHLNSPKTQLFLVSFLILYLELILIRYIPAQMRYVGFFSNIILLASFVGIGLGTLFSKKIKLPFYYFLPLILFFQLFLNIFQYDLVIDSNQVIYFTSTISKFTAEPVFLLPLIFIFVSAIIFLPSVLLGKIFGKFSSLEAYRLNIGGSIAGIICFAILSFLRVGPAIWFVSIIFLSFLLIKVKLGKKMVLILIATAISLLIEINNLPNVENTSELIVWSPYYKVKLSPLRLVGSDNRNNYVLTVNNIGHQTLMDPNHPEADFFYQYPYILESKKRLNKVLVIGSGGGNDVAKALKENVKEVVAVEIDPVIFELGKKYHPLRPYSSPKVRLVNDDGRHYLVTTKERFDAIIFALTDSLTLTSSHANLRLESYLFTKEAMEQAKSRLNPDGIVVLYNYYRQRWLVEKLTKLLEVSFNRKPIVISRQTSIGEAAVIIVRNSHSDKNQPTYGLQPAESAPNLPTDDWPFLYLKTRQIPYFYLKYLSLIIIILLVIFVYLSNQYRLLKNYKNFFSFFFLGAAFMLLETKNVVQFSLLFGSTWITNVFVFVGLLSLVYLAILVSQKYRHLNIKLLYLALFLTIFMNLLFPQRELLNIAYIPRLIIAILINFSPVFIANLIFAQLFAKTKIASAAYGANTLGSFAGGIAEYFSLITGYKNLVILVGILYLLSFLSLKKIR